MRTWILDRFQVYARVCLMAAIFISPVVFNRKTQDVFNLLKLSVIFVGVVSALAIYVMWSSERGIWLPKMKLALPVGLFLGACLLSTVFSLSPRLSLLGLYHRYGGFIPFLLYACFMALLVGLYWEKPHQIREIAGASAAASLLLTAYVLIQAAGLDWIPWKDGTGNTPPFPVGTMGNSNFAGGYLGIAVPFVAYLAATAKGELARMGLWLLLALDLIALWFTQTRGGMIAGAAGLGAMIFLYRERFPRWIRLSAIAAGALAGILAVLVLFHPGTDEPIGPLRRIETFRTGTFEVRTFYWTTAFRIFREDPIIGTGLDTYYAGYPRLRQPEDGAQLGLTITDKPHNIFLEYLANGGLLGLGTYLALVGAALYFGYRYSRRLDDPLRFLLVAFMSVLVGYLAQGIFSIDVPPLAALGWIAIGGIATIADPGVLRARETIQESKPQRPGKKRVVRKESARVKRHDPVPVWAHLGATALAVILVLLGTRPVLADVKVKEAATAQNAEGSEDQATELYDEAIRTNPLEPSYRSQAGAWLETIASKSTDREEQRVLYTRARDYYLQALELQPDNIFFLVNLARVHTSWAERVDPSKYEEADRWWKLAVAHDPTDWDVHNKYALMLNSHANHLKGDRGARLKTAERLEIVVRIKPDLLAAWINLAKVYSAVGEKEKALASVERARQLDPADEEVQSLFAQLSSTQSATG